jgi:pyruvate kinase
MYPIECTKIIATIGPATASLERIRELIRAGADACRVNFSHGDGATLGPLMETIREAERLEGRAVAILADIQGPKLRIGTMPAAGALLVEGNTFTLTPREIEGSDVATYTAHERLCEDVEPGARILLADGTIELVVESVQGRDVVCRVITGGRLFSRKGLNLPGRKVSTETLTEKDRKDLAYLGRTDVDIVAISFVRTPRDLELARELLGSKRKIAVIAKLERPEAISCLESILDASDGIMVARGDLGVELPFEQVPLVQKRILEVATRRGKWAIVATQMLASMVNARRPTRAEASDVMNAVLDGADAVMLSEETAVGDNPALAVKAMDALTRSAEEYDRGARTVQTDPDSHSFASTSAGAAVLAANQLKASAIVTLGGSGLTSVHVSKWLPKLPIVALSSSAATLRRTNLLRGVRPVQIPERADAEQQLEIADRFLIEAGWAKEGDVIVVVAAFPLGTRRETNTIRFHRVRAPGSPPTVWPGAG